MTVANKAFALKLQRGRPSSGPGTAGGHGGCHSGRDRWGQAWFGAEGGFVLVPWFLG